MNYSQVVAKVRDWHKRRDLEQRLTALQSQLTIEVRRRSDDYHAQIKDHPELWGCGPTPSHAVGDLVRTHREATGITLE
jgi:hypothetical protein